MQQQQQQQQPPQPALRYSTESTGTLANCANTLIIYQNRSIGSDRRAHFLCFAVVVVAAAAELK